MSDFKHSPSPPKLANPRRRWTIAGIAAATTAAVVGGLALKSSAMGRPFGRGAAMDPETAGRRIDAMVSWMLADVDASAEQKAKISAISKAAAADLKPLRAQHLQARRQSVALLAAPTIDRAQLEKMRIDQMQLGETASRRLLQAMMDSAEVLTPEQRSRLAEKWQRRMPTMG